MNFAFHMKKLVFVILVLAELALSTAFLKRLVGIPNLFLGTGTIGLAVLFIPAKLRCIRLVLINGMPKRLRALQFAIAALDYKCTKINEDEEDRRKMDISLMENEDVDSFYKVNENIGTFASLCLVCFAHLLGYTKVSIIVKNSIAKEPLQLRGKDVQFSIRKSWKFIILFMRLFVVAKSIKFTKASFSLTDEKTWLKVELLEKNTDAEREQEPTALHRAVVEQNQDEIKRLLDQEAIDVGIQDEDGFTAYETALKRGHVESVRPFLTAHQRKTLRKETLVYLAALENNARVVDGVLSSLTPEEVQASLEYENERGNTALHAAVEKGSPGVVKRLLKEVRDPGKTNKRGETALDIATRIRGHNTRIVQLLAEKSDMVVNHRTGVFVPQYPIKKTNARGICLVINNVEFEEESGLENRTGAEEDDERIKALFEKLGFKVVVKRNLTRIEMEAAFQYYSNAYGNCSHENYDAFVCVISSHGGSGDKVYGTDGRPLRVEDILWEFGPSRCPSLSGKPKMFFIQSCRGSREPAGAPPQPGYDHAPVDAPSDAPLLSSIPAEGDFLVVSSTVPGQKAYRYEGAGSWFISKFVEVVEAYHMDHDLETMITMLRGCMAKADLQFKQIPCSVSTLRKALYL